MPKSTAGAIHERADEGPLSVQEQVQSPPSAYRSRDGEHHTRQSHHPVPEQRLRPDTSYTSLHEASVQPYLNGVREAVLKRPASLAAVPELVPAFEGRHASYGPAPRPDAAVW